MTADLENLQNRLGHTFQNTALLTQALTHRSHGSMHNERLEFLGDSVLGLIIAEILFQQFPEASEGELSRMRSTLVKRDALVKVATYLDLGSQISLGAGEKKSGGKRRASILADAVESLLAAVYLDGGLNHCREVVLRIFSEQIELVSDGDDQKDHKTRLQELLQARSEALPVYNVTKIDGRAHEQIFTVSCEVSLLDKPMNGSGRTKRVAEQNAAEKALTLLEDNG